ncbi:MULTISPECIES: non-ribosomal peptide synthetase [Streptomycetaceae]|uniref:Putative hybrid non-ribosomal peptide synthetase/polyketide synthase n=1 Tax=Streptantibioticus cattleyicolor (strain ATCC 35852 / DSM 46488 / JCM 4925 / NBRC 14057 / NRRL 8057) TaxID=1003195 RepID=F8JYE3_STREN|nr:MULTISPECIES: non-ribosomal peptide synthetase [Streptomycetaceae]AEW95939.1 putative hybrid non-ribosomal peptide synthetase/polyketide synthase [Streptantibioticus cattleyicolor NRRL 8057 = DSM 46488]MYS60475.1 non-ribosomal peptide synthetase [Streptomyces sp. SID5468]CCB76274.1 putative hybrid non-ribosomal peptide synthetase/polyketide synthase [Streptantibioticus cattleyicolor NRRL 8057 = DSM 46488]
MNAVVKEVLAAVADGTLTEEQALPLLRRLAPEPATAPEPAPADAAPTGPYPLSRGQAALWAIHLAAPEGAAYNLPMALRLRPDVDLDVLRRAVEAVVERNPGLRINVRSGPDGPEQRIAERAWTVTDLDLGPLTEQELTERIRGLVRVPFDLERDPLYRVYFLRGPASGPLMLLLFHHLITDGVSSHLMLRDIVAGYASLTRDGTLPEPERRTPYAEFVRWQRRMLAGPEGAEHRAYWSRELAGAGTAPVLDRIADHRRGGAPSFLGRSVQFELDPDAWQAVRGAARELGLTPFSVVHAAFVALLHRHTGVTDIPVSVPTDGRADQRFDRTLGYLINPVVLRTGCTADTTARQLIESVHDRLLAAEDHSAYPFAAVVDDLRRGGHPETSFDIGFYLQQGVGRDLDMDAGQTLFTDALAITQEGESDLVMEVVVRGDRALVHLKYDPELFERATVERLAGHYRLLLDRMIRQPDRPIGEFELRTADERELVRRANDTTAGHPCHLTAVDLVLAQAARTPGHPALADAEETIDYATLAHRVELLAARLRERGVGRGSLVGVAARRRAGLVVALLAVHRAGAAYVPLDPAFPAARLAYIAEDAGLAVVVTDKSSADRLPATGAAPVVLDDVDWTAAAPPAPPARRHPEGTVNPDPAYVLYTSGSTGEPKGVEVGHGALVNFLCAMAERPGCTADDRLLALTTVSFDIAALELLLPLTRGGTVEIAPEEVARDGIALAERLAAAPVTMVQATPATWQMLLSAGWTGRPGLRVLCGGEALTRDLADKLLARADEVWNMYGPTETTIWSSVERVRRHRPIGVGTPVDNTRLHVLDGDGRPVPFGAVGELYIAGHGVALGYRGRTALTEEKFPDGAFLGESGRVFRTGDAARHLPDGRLALLGRLDRQVKLRGFRIELREIEAAARRSDLVEEARVLLREDVAGHQALVGFVRPPAGRPVPADLAARVRAELAEWLPGYMVPARVVPLESFPQTPNAKIDTGPLQRLELDEIVRRHGHPAARQPEPEPPAADGVAGPAADADAADPAGELRTRLRGWVAEIAGVPEEEVATGEPIGDYGFDSIRFTRLSALLRDRLGVTVAPTVFYGHPTVDALTAHLLRRFPDELAAVPRPRTAARVTAPVATAAAPAPAPASGYEPVAVVGIGGRLPESETLEEFWDHLAAGRDLVRPYPLERGFSRALFGRYADGDPAAFSGSYVKDVAAFDAALFRISPREAAQMDPQHRLLLHAARQAMEDSGTAPGALSATRTGVFVGISGADYFSLLGHERRSDDHFLIGNVASVAANRISHLFNLHGPSTIYDTACSSSLVAVHRAVRALQRGDCDAALAGGANLLLSPYGFLGLRRAGMLSPDGRCKTFDARADGYGRGEGVVLLMLKRLARARADGDPVHGVIIGSAENHGGRTHSLTVPNPRAQTDVVFRAHDAAGVPPESIGYIEAHGTGTELGDPIEVDGLKDAFARLLERKAPTTGEPRIALGSVKTNIGHLEAAAGVAGVVKVLLAMKHRTLPGLVHLTRPNPMLDFDGSPFRLQTRTTAWEPWCDDGGTAHPRRAGVSSFGMGGSNVHVVLEEAEER